jgi:transketolase
MLLGSEKKTADMRGAYGDTLVELGRDDPRIVCVGGDTTESLKTKKFGDKYPERMFNVGIAEANIVSVAAGLVIAGKIAFASTYAAFIPCFSRRAYGGTRWSLSSADRRHCRDESNP